MKRGTGGEKRGGFRLRLMGMVLVLGLRGCLGRGGDLGGWGWRETEGGYRMLGVWRGFGGLVGGGCEVWMFFCFWLECMEGGCMRLSSMAFEEQHG